MKDRTKFLVVISLVFVGANVPFPYSFPCWIFASYWGSEIYNKLY